MNTNIFIPTKINVGFQNRKDTYTGKLAYVIYYDAKGKLRKEKSWQSWRNHDIPNEEFDNEPTEGFVLNKKVGGYKTHWDARQTYTRVYDPRGFEFEITIPNLLWILENCNCIKGKGLEGKFVYGWDGMELVLVPVDSADYEEITAKNKVIHNNEFIKAKDLIIGATYENFNGEYLVYMGKAPEYTYEISDYDNSKQCYEKPVDRSWNIGIEYYEHDKYHPRLYHSKMLKEKTYWFIKLGNPNAESNYEKQHSVVAFSSLSKKLYRVVNEKVHDDYIALTDILNGNDGYSPIDYFANKIIDLPFENFQTIIYATMSKITEHNYRYYTHTVGIRVKDNTEQLKTVIVGYNPKNKTFFSNENVLVSSEFALHKEYDTRIQEFNSLEELYQALQPVYGEQYLDNNYLYRRYYYYGTKK